MSRLFPNQNVTPTHITIEESSFKRKIPLEEILFVKAEHVYVRIYLSNSEKVLYRISLNDFYRQLPKNSFTQVHRSFIVNQDKVDQLKKSQILIRGHRIPISRSRQKRLNNILMAC